MQGFYQIQSRNVYQQIKEKEIKKKQLNEKV